jgi:predicted RNA-binding Zn ribbon-like protein
MTAIWLEFVNSEAHDALGQGRDEDRLEKPGWLEAFRSRWGLPALDAGDEGVRAALRGLRGVIRRSALRLAAGKDIRPADVGALNQALRAQPVVSQLKRKQGQGLRLELVPVTGGLEAALHAIARSFAEFLCEGERARLRVCENPDCQWLFYDTTRSRTRRWCADSCGNLIKVRRFRQRRRSGAGGEAGADETG